MKRFFAHLVSAAVLSLGIAATAQALPIVSLSNEGQLNSSVTGVTHIDFNSGCGYASCSGDYAVVSGSQSGLYAQPLGVNSPYLSVPNPSPTTQTAVFGLGGMANYFGLFWGSIDSYNSISFYLNSALIASYSGANIVGQFANGNQLSYSSNRYVNFDFGGDSFDTVTLISTGFAFESDNHAFKNITRVSEPATFLLIVFGLIGLAVVRRRMRKQPTQS